MQHDLVRIYNRVMDWSISVKDPSSKRDRVRVTQNVKEQCSSREEDGTTGWGRTNVRPCGGRGRRTWCSSWCASAARRGLCRGTCTPTNFFRVVRNCGSAATATATCRGNSCRNMRSVRSHPPSFPRGILSFHHTGRSASSSGPGCAPPLPSLAVILDSTIPGVQKHPGGRITRVGKASRGPAGLGDYDPSLAGFLFTSFLPSRRCFSLPLLSIFYACGQRMLPCPLTFGAGVASS